MRTVTLNTGVQITFDKYDNMIEVKSPYTKDKVYKKSILEYYRMIIKQIIA